MNSYLQNQAIRGNYSIKDYIARWAIYNMIRFTDGEVIGAVKGGIEHTTDSFIDLVSSHGVDIDIHGKLIVITINI